MNDMRPDVNKPVENPRLTALLREWHAADRESVGEVTEKIAAELAEKAYLLAVINVDDDAARDNGDGTATFQKGSTISFEFLTNTAGTTFLPVFTDWTELRKWDKYKDANVKTLIVSFDDMAAITAGRGGIAVNPFSDNFVISPQNVAHMKQHKDILTKGVSEQTVTQDTTVQLGEPANYPTAMVEAIKRHAEKVGAIKAMWLKLMIKDGEKSYLIVVDADGDPRAHFKGIADAGVPHLEPGMFIDMVPLASDFGRKAATGQPFYQRQQKSKLFGLFRK